MKSFKTTLVFALSFIASTLALAEPPKGLVEALKTYAAGEAPSISDSPIPGIYEVVIGAQLFYLSGDGRYMLKGSIIDIPNAENVSESRRSEVRKVAMGEVSTDEMIVYSPEAGKKHTITVFTDIDCGYCRKLHQELDQYLDRGIEIQYLLYPRSGTRSAAYDKSISVWCSDDRKTSLTAAKRGDTLESKRCENPVGDHMVLGRDFGVTGTPTIILADGSVIPGYVPANALEEMLNKIDSGK